MPPKVALNALFDLYAIFHSGFQAETHIFKSEIAYFQRVGTL